LFLLIFLGKCGKGAGAGCGPQKFQSMSRPDYKKPAPKANYRSNSAFAFGRMTGQVNGGWHASVTWGVGTSEKGISGLLTLGG